MVSIRSSCKILSEDLTRGWRIPDSFLARLNVAVLQVEMTGERKIGFVQFGDDWSERKIGFVQFRDDWPERKTGFVQFRDDCSERKIGFVQFRDDCSESRGVPRGILRVVWRSESVTRGQSPSLLPGNF